MTNDKIFVEFEKANMADDKILYRRKIDVTGRRYIRKIQKN